MRGRVVVVAGALLGALTGIARGIWQVRPGQPSDGPMTALVHFTARYMVWGLLVGGTAACLLWVLSRRAARDRQQG